MYLPTYPSTRLQLLIPDLVDISGLMTRSDMFARGSMTSLGYVLATVNACAVSVCQQSIMGSLQQWHSAAFVLLRSRSRGSMSSIYCVAASTS